MLGKVVFSCLKCEFSFYARERTAVCPACGAVFERDREGEWKFIHFIKEAQKG